MYNRTIITIAVLQIRCTHVPSKRRKSDDDNEAFTDMKSFELNAV